MKRHILPNPPNPDDYNYKANPLAWQRALYQWALDSKGKLERDSQINDTPLDQGFVLGSYTLTTSIAGTSTGTQITNFICSFIASLTRKGIVSQNTPGGNL